MKSIKSTVAKKQRLNGIHTAAREFGVTAHHLRLVVSGERTSPGLLAKWQAFNREYERFLSRVRAIAAK